jgi:DNA-binding CsgD family transcriptional regulator
VNAILQQPGFTDPSSDPPDGALDVIERVTAELAAADRQLVQRLRADLASLAPLAVGSDPSPEDRLHQLGPTLTGATGNERRLLAMLAYRETRLFGSAESAAQLAERALANGHLPADGLGSPELFAAGIALGLAGRTETSVKLFGDIARRAQRADSRAVLCAALGQRGVEHYRRGALMHAREDLESAAGIARGQIWEGLVDDRRSHLLRVHAERGAVDLAERMLERWGVVGALPETTLGNQLLVERGRLRLIAGRPHEAVADLGCAAQRLESPADSIAFEWRRPAALAYRRMGEHQAALAMAQEELEIAEAWGAPRQHGAAAAALGLIEGGRRGIQRLRDAVEILGSSPARFEHARAEVDLGAALRRDGQPTEARQQLRAGLELAVRCGSPRLVELARQELDATGIRRRRRIHLSGTSALTPSEGRVARLAAEGLSNPQIATMLFVTRKTVEMHLGNVYRKLGINSRAQLGSTLDFAA